MWGVIVSAAVSVMIALALARGAKDADEHMEKLMEVSEDGRNANDE